jgi:hypothetical protein
VALRVCIDCMATIPAGRTRCQPCERLRDKARGSREERGYDHAHRKERARYQSYMDEGVRYRCWRCGRPINPNPKRWHLGHCDVDRSRHHGPEHVSCNTATSGRTGCPHRSHR